MGAANATLADSESAATVCAEAARLATGDKTYEIESLSRPLLLLPRFNIELRSESAKQVKCVVSSNKVRSISINPRDTVASR